MISRFLEVILTENIDTKSSLVSKLQIEYICSIRICSRNRDIIEKPQFFDSIKKLDRYLSIVEQRNQLVQAVEGTKLEESLNTSSIISDFS